jgi:CSLREA domain-containing protein
MAATYTVNNTGDQEDETPGAEGCKTSGSTCTLRAAIEEANFDSGADTIKFDATFNGQVADSIALGSSLPAIEFPLTIDGDAEGAGGQCMTEAGVKGPCAEVTGPVGGAALIVENADKVAIEGLALTGQTGGGSAIIDVIDSSEEFKAADDWLGVRLDGTSSSNTKGIYLDPGSDKAVIGGINAADRNVIANTEFEGLDIEGANEATIQGNYFGVKPDGTTAAPNSKNIEITGRTGLTPGEDIEAEDNEIGATIEGPALTSAACDGGCNVISGATGAGIDLNGSEIESEKPASGPTTIHGNFIGLNAAGTGTIANGSYGLLAGHADDVTVGEFPLGDANYFAGSSEAIATEEGENFIARGNSFGIGPNGAELTKPDKAIFALDQGVTTPPSIELNLIFTGSIGIEQRGKVGHLTANEVIGGSVGIYARGEPGGGLIASNFISAASENGILVDGPDNEVRANTVLESGEAGIKFRNPPGIAMTGGLIGGNTGEKENVIEGSGGPAIEILEEALEPGSVTEITRNRGSANNGPFIELVNGANEGILPPAFTAAAQSQAEGTAEPGATIRVFSKKAAEPGEIASFLGEAVADGSGNWKVTYSGSISGGTIVAATQTNVEGGTSELSTASTVADPDKGNGDKGKVPEGCAPTHDSICGVVTAPSTKIKSGPKGKVKATTAKFKFSSPAKGAKFECKLDKGKFKPCKSPKTYKKLKLGKHVFKVRAVANGLADPTPAKRKFKIVA